MSTQFDLRVRVVNVTNLRAMCDEVSGVKNSLFHVSEVTRSRVHVTLSDIYMMGEAGQEEASAQLTVVFPCYPGEETPQAENPRVVLEPLRYINVDQRFRDRQYDLYQLFEPLVRAPHMYQRQDGTWFSEHDAGKDV